ncbi:MAG: flagellin, partial [Synergistaceae bacterium]|nr:flagellin [Synergistaceae bacterium]
MVIQHNIPALQSYNIVNNTSNALQKSIAKLSSGLRINSAADDAAGLAISEKMRSQVRGLDRAVANTQDGISLIQTAEGALGETHSILQRMRELAVQGANDTLTQQDRSYIQEEIDQLKEEITRIGNTTQFNKKKLLNGDSAGLWSSSDMETKAIINGGLREVDQFGQKKSVEGNYKIRVKAEPGQAQVQKSDIMTIKHDGVLTNKSINAPDGIKDVSVSSMTPGDYSIKLTDSSTAPAAAQITGDYDVGGTQYTKLVNRTDASDATVILAATTGGTAANSVSVTTKLHFKIGDNDLGDVTLTGKNNNTTQSTAVNGANLGTILAGGDATVTVSGLDDVIGNARKLGIEITNLNATGINTSQTATGSGTTTNSIVMKQFGSANMGDLSITYGTTGTENTLALFNDSAADGSKIADSGTEIAASDVFSIVSSANNELNGSVLFEVTGRDDMNGILTLKATDTLMDKNGKNSTASQDNIVLKQGGATVGLGDIFGTTTSGTPAVTTANATIKLNDNMYTALSDGSKMVVNFSAGKATT